MGYLIEVNFFFFFFQHVYIREGGEGFDLGDKLIEMIVCGVMKRRKNY